MPTPNNADSPPGGSSAKKGTKSPLARSISQGRPFVRFCMVTTYVLVHVGSRVRVRDQDGDAEFTVVGPEDSDVAVGRISDDSPLGQALLGHGPGDAVDVRAPGGLRTVTIVDVD